LALASAQWESQLDTHERQSYLDLFTKVDSDNKGIALKDEAMAFFSKSSIPTNILSEVKHAYYSLLSFLISLCLN
jgi:hypothetical protein